MSSTDTIGIMRLDGDRYEVSVVPPHSKLRSFESKCTGLKKVSVTLLQGFGAPRSDSAVLPW